MKDEFIYYSVYWFQNNSKLIKCRKFYDKKSAFEWYETFPKEQRYEVTKHTESIEVIA